MFVDGVYNMRDIGGWITADGKTIKQGLLYRGTELDGVFESNYKITSDGILEMLQNLKIKTDMDLRAADKSMGTFSPLGIGVTRRFYNTDMYETVFTQEGKEKIKRIFTDLAKEENYPVYMHCTYGIDRTGTVCYILEALLGLSEDDLLKEYKLSALGYYDLNITSVLSFIDEFKAFEGDTMQAKAENYLLSAGITQQQIESIKDIFLD